MRTLTLASLVVFLVARSTPAAAADKVRLLQEDRAGQISRVVLEVSVSGVQVHLRDEKTSYEMKFTAKGKLAYDEKVVEASSDAPRRKTLRYYSDASVESAVQDKKTVLELRAPVRIMVAELRRERPFLFSPAGPLTFDERELVQGEGALDTLTIARLLPIEAVAVGDTWKPDNAAIAAAFNLYSVSENQLVAKVESLDDATARIRLAGKLDALVAGTTTRLDLDARIDFDRKRAQIVAVELKQKEERARGPAEPALRVDATLVLTCTLDAASKRLSDKTLEQMPLAANPATEQLVYLHPDGRFRFYYPRDWRIFQSDTRLAILRLIDDNEAIAQCNITPGPTVVPGNHMKPEDFRSQVRQALGDHFEKFFQEGEVPAARGYWIYRLAAAGVSDKDPAVWYYYLVAGPQGQQLVLTFAVDARLTERFGPRDLAVVGTVEFGTPRTASSSK
jgi:hypothetical protein